MADETSQMEVEQENLALVIADQPVKTANPQYYDGTMFGLPKEWIAEIRPRKASSKYFGKVDQFFYEPGTHRQFRSLKAVKRHLGLDVGPTSHNRKPQASKADRQPENVKEKEKLGRDTKVAEDCKSEDNYYCFDKIAKRVKRQLINGEENSWKIYIRVPDAVQQRWMACFSSSTTIAKKATREG